MRPILPHLFHPTILKLLFHHHFKVSHFRPFRENRAKRTLGIALKTMPTKDTSDDAQNFTDLCVTPLFSIKILLFCKQTGRLSNEG